jgi:hypothetical protein
MAATQHMSSLAAVSPPALMTAASGAWPPSPEGSDSVSVKPKAALFARAASARPFPSTVEKLPSTVEKLPSTAEKLPSTTEKLPSTTEGLPVSRLDLPPW